MTDIAELTDEQLHRAIPARLRKRLMQGCFESGEDIVALRKFVGLTQEEFAQAIEIYRKVKFLFRNILADCTHHIRQGFHIRWMDGDDADVFVHMKDGKIQGYVIEE